MIDKEKVLDVIEDLECELSFCRAVETNNTTLFVSDLEDYLNVIKCLKEENDNYGHNNKNLTFDIMRLNTEIKRLKEAVAIYKDIAEDWKYEVKRLAKRLEEMVGKTDV